MLTSAEWKPARCQVNCSTAHANRSKRKPSREEQHPRKLLPILTVLLDVVPVPILSIGPCKGWNAMREYLRHGLFALLMTGLLVAAIGILLAQYQLSAQQSLAHRRYLVARAAAELGSQRLADAEGRIVHLVTDRAAVELEIRRQFRMVAENERLVLVAPTEH